MSASRLKEKRNNRALARHSPKWSRASTSSSSSSECANTTQRVIESVRSSVRPLLCLCVCVIIKREKNTEDDSLSHEFQYCMASARAIKLIEPNSISNIPYTQRNVQFSIDVPQRLLELIAFSFFFISFHFHHRREQKPPKMLVERQYVSSSRQRFQ